MHPEDVVPMLNERACGVLRAVVESYIEKPEPVGSGAIVKSHDFNLSPATIRSVMAELEEAGFLSQPHTSAGRTPTDQGFRYYALYLVEPVDLSSEQAQDIHRAAYSFEWLELTGLMESVVKSLSNLSRHASLAGLISLGSAPIKKAQFVHIRDRMALAVIIMANGETRHYFIKARDDISQDSLDKMTNYFNDRFSFFSLAQIRRLLFREIQKEKNQANKMMISAFWVTEEIEKQANHDNADKIYIEGANNLLSQSDRSGDYEIIKALFETLSEKERLVSLLDECIKSDGINLTIGAESQIEGLSGFSVITHPFSGYGGMEGAVGIIGRKRMDYGHVMALVAYAAKSVGERLSSDRTRRAN